MEIKCPVCKSEEKFAELRVCDYSVTLSEEGNVEDSDFSDFLDFSFIYCRDCLTYLGWDSKKNKWIEAKEEDILSRAFDIISTLLNRNIKCEDFDKMKKLLMLNQIESENGN